MDSSGIWARKKTKPGISGPSSITTTRRRGLKPYQVKILVAVLVVVLGCMLCIFSVALVREYKKASKLKAEKEEPIKKSEILKKASLAALTFWVRFASKVKENKEDQSPNQVETHTGRL